MHKRKITVLAAAVMCAGALLFTGCGTDVVSGTGSGSAIEESSADAESAAESYVISLTSRWYDAEGNSLGNATIEIYNGDQMIYTGTTSASGSLATCAFPSDTKLKFTVTGEDGTTLAESYLKYSVSDAYDQITITPLTTEDTAQTLGLPTDSTSVDSALFINEDGVIETANISMNRSNSGTTTSEEEDSAADEDTGETTEESSDESADENAGESTEDSAEESAE